MSDNKSTAVLENIRIVAGAKGEFTNNFKKSLWGLGKKEVDEYINNLTQNLKKAEQIFEEKLLEIQNNLNMVKRERDSLSSSAEVFNKKEIEYQNKIRELSVQVVEQKDRADNFAGLEEKYLELIEEYKKLQESAKLYDELKIKNAEITAKSEVFECDNIKLNEKNNFLESKVKELINENMALQKKYELIYKEMKIDIHQQLSKDKIIVDKLKHQLIELTEAVDSLNLKVEY